MPTLGELIGSEKKTLVDFPENFMRNEEMINGVVKYNSYREIRNGRMLLLNNRAVVHKNVLLAFLKDDLENCKARHTRRVIVHIKYARTPFDDEVDIFHGDLSQKVIDEFIEFFG